MPGSPNTSFIPKRNPVHNERRNSKQTFYIGSFIVQVVFVATLLATAVVFFYEQTVKSALDKEILSLNDSVATFKDADMQKVIKMDLSLNQVKYRLDHAVSIVSILKAIEDATIDNAYINSFKLDRKTDKAFLVDATIETDSFDSILFQRKILSDSPNLVISKLDDINLENTPPDNGLFTSELKSDRIKVAFKVALDLEASNFPHNNTPTLPSAEVLPRLEANLLNNMTNQIEANQTEI